MRFLLSLVVTAVLSMTTVSNAADVVPPSESLRVGKTNILCVQAPCPWRGISRAETMPSGPSGLLWAQQTLPPLDAASRDAERVRQAWDNDQCLVINGKMTGGILRVDEIVGACA
nr:hypothetical protein [uncultured Devosia sp.]